MERQDSHVSAQSGAAEADEAPSSSETSDEQQARCSPTERPSAGTQSTGVRVGRAHKLSQCAKLKEQEESATKDLMEYQDDLADADYTPSQSVFSVSCIASFIRTVDVMPRYYLLFFQKYRKELRLGGLV